MESRAEFCVVLCLSPDTTKHTPGLKSFVAMGQNAEVGPDTRFQCLLSQSLWAYQLLAGGPQSRGWGSASLKGRLGQMLRLTPLTLCLSRSLDLTLS
jgi:hypothetical protein